MPLRIQVKGYRNKTNDIIFKHALSSLNQYQTLVFFGGDVQDYPEKMKVHKSNKQYNEWNLENTANLLSQQFPNSHIVIVKPCRMELGTLSCYDNFVVSYSGGVPDHSGNHYALIHLERLIKNLYTRLGELACSNNSKINTESGQIEKEDVIISPANTSYLEQNDERPTMSKVNTECWKDVKIHEYPLTLIGFSKGCVVLNQFLHEFHFNKTTKTNLETLKFMEKIKDMYWLDGGHSGGRDTWVTSASVLKTFSQLGINIYIHVSPYQVHDDGRPWIGIEEATFTRLLTKFKAKVKRYLHGEPDSPHTLETHFRLLKNFVQVQNTFLPTNISNTEN